MRRPSPYGWSAPFYDLISAEWPVYRAGRVARVEALGLRPGDRVVDVGWSNVDLVHGNAAALHGVVEPADGLIFVYALSLVRPWPAAWDQALAVVRSGGRIAVVDMQEPTGAARILTPLARLACRAGGSDIDAHPWLALDRDLTDVSARSLRGGHIQARAGTVP